MIKDFKDKLTERIFNQDSCKELSKDVQKVALRKLIMLDCAENLSDLKVPPGNRLELLSGDRKGQYSIRVNDKYRLVFTPIDGGKNFKDVQIIDYH